MLRGLTLLAWLAFAMSLAAQPGFSQASSPAGRLAPGKPAGVQQARSISTKSLFIGTSIVLVALAFVLPASSTSSTTTAIASTN
jgi:hypothetical protein